MITELPIPDFQIGLIQDERIIKMTDKRCKYKFNWLDHLYYFGMGNDEMPLNWRHLTPFYVSVNSILIWPVAFYVILWHESDPLKSIYTLGIFCVIISLYDWPLEKYHFTPERERTYFRSHPQRKHISANTVWWLSLTITLTNFVLLGLVIILR